MARFGTLYGVRPRAQAGDIVKDAMGTRYLVKSVGLKYYTITDLDGKNEKQIHVLNAYPEVAVDNPIEGEF